MSNRPAVVCWLCGHDMDGVEQTAEQRNNPYRNGACACCQPILTEVLDRIEHRREAGEEIVAVTITAVKPPRRGLALPAMVKLTGVFLVLSFALSIFSFIIRTQS